MQNIYGDYRCADYLELLTLDFGLNIALNLISPRSRNKFARRILSIITLVLVLFIKLQVELKKVKSMEPSQDQRGTIIASRPKLFSLQDVSKHSDGSSSWIVIEDGVYDVTNFLAEV